MVMVMDLIIKLKNFLYNNSESGKLTSALRLNVILSVLFKFISVITSLLLVPLTIKFVDTTIFGIWLTINSIVFWFSVLDIGLTNGLRNKLVKSLSIKDYELAKIYVSTTYIVMFFIFIAIGFILGFLNSFLNWSNILNIPEAYNHEVKKAVWVILIYFCSLFILKIINSILFADQKAAFTSLIDLLGQIFVLITIFIMSRFLQGSLFQLSLGMCVIPIIVAFIFNLILFKGRYSKIIPSFKYFRRWCINDLMGISIKFFIIQFAFIIQYQTANFIIGHYFNMDEVTNYNIVFKYFSIISILFLLILQPLWSATTEAYNNKDFQWIRKIVKKYLKLFVVITILGFIMLLIADYVYTIWIGKNIISIPFTLSLWGLLYILTGAFSGIFVNTLNGIGAIRIQFLLSLFTPLLYIFLCIFFISHLHWGIYAVFIAAIISNINGFLVAPIQFVKIFLHNKKGIWTA